MYTHFNDHSSHENAVRRCRICPLHFLETTACECSVHDREPTAVCWRVLLQKRLPFVRQKNVCQRSVIPEEWIINKWSHSYFAHFWFTIFPGNYIWFLRQKWIFVCSMAALGESVSYKIRVAFWIFVACNVRVWLTSRYTLALVCSRIVWEIVGAAVILCTSRRHCEGWNAGRCRCSCCCAVLELAVAASKTDPPDVLDRQKCLDALAEQRRSKWFQVCSLSFHSSVSDITL